MMRFLVTLASLLILASPARSQETKLYSDFWTGQSRADLAREYPLDEHGHLTFTRGFEEGSHGFLLFKDDRLTAVGFSLTPSVSPFDLSGRFEGSRFRPLTLRSKGNSVDIVGYLARGGKAEALTEMMMVGFADHDLAVIYAEADPLPAGATAAGILAQLPPQTRMLLVKAGAEKTAVTLTSRAYFEQARQ